MMLLSLILLFLVEVLTSEGQDLIKTDTYKDTLPNSVYISQEVRSVIDCSALCFRTITCMAIFYEESTKRCYVHDQYMQSLSDGHGIIGVQYYVMQMPMVNGWDCTIFPNSCLKVLAGTYTWFNGDLACTGLGDHLVIVDNAVKQMKLETLMAQEGLPSVWLGLSDIAYEGVMQFVNGSNLVGYSNFRAGEPNNAGGSEDCVYTSHDWNDAQCADTFNTICEMEN